MVEKIDEAKRILNMQNAFGKVLQTKDPFGEMFQLCIQEKQILCPTDGYYLNREQFKALQDTLITLGENKVYFSEIEADECFSDNSCSHWEISVMDSYEEYLKLPVILENSLYSLNGRWGILISQEEHAVIGGTSEFMAKYKEYYTNWFKGERTFCQKWEYNKKTIIPISVGFQSLV
ncbi:MAG: hypothetical protein ACRC76_02405 [Proteocatella sp.]